MAFSPCLFAEGRPTLGLRDGCVIVDVHVRYRGQLRHEDTPLDVAMWTLDHDDLRVCQAVGRDLTEQEWTTYVGPDLAL